MARIMILFTSVILISISDNIPVHSNTVLKCGTGPNTYQKQEVGVVKDIDGNSYKTVKIGNQVWMAENLRVTHFQNGDPIRELENSGDWTDADEKARPRIAAWCYYDNNPKNNDKYGKLYNWHAINDKKGIAPKGWHIPSVAEFKVLEKFGKGLQSIEGWVQDEGRASNPNGTNQNGFNGFPGGCRSLNGFDNFFEKAGVVGLWWTSDTYDEYSSCCSALTSAGMSIEEYSNRDGLSVRCIKD